MTNYQNKQVIILFGPPGAGKGTQAILLTEKLDFFHFETSGIIEKIIAGAKEGDFIEVNGGKYYFSKEKELWKSGKVWDPPFVVHFVKEKIKTLFEEGKSIIFSGSPRTAYEAEKIIPLLKELYGQENIKVCFINISAEQTIYRNSHRKICELMRHSILFSKETENLSSCPLDGSKLLKRELDNPETIKVRIKEFQERTFPMIDIFKKEGIKINEINGEQSVSDVYKDILGVVK